MVAFTLSVFAILTFLWLASAALAPLQPESYRFTVNMPRRRRCRRRTCGWGRERRQGEVEGLRAARARASRSADSVYADPEG